MEKNLADHVYLPTLLQSEKSKYDHREYEFEHGIKKLKIKNPPLDERSK
jgi:hypothetical protein